MTIPVGLLADGVMAAPVAAAAHSSRLRATCRRPSGAAAVPKHRHGALVPRRRVMCTPAANPARTAAASNSPARAEAGKATSTAIAASDPAITPAESRGLPRANGNGRVATQDANDRKAGRVRSLASAETANTMPIRARQPSAR